MGKLLHDLGEGYPFEMVDAKEIRRRPELLDEYDVLFLTCAPGGEELKTALSRFVSRGGTLYASDFRYDALAAAFPEIADLRNAAAGAGPQDVEADVVDPSLRELLGPKIKLRFDLPGWKSASFRGPRVTTLLEGDFQRHRGALDIFNAKTRGPLLVKFTVNKGTVIFTSFHNEKQNSELEKKLLQYLVFSLVTATLDGQLNSTIEQAGFSSTNSNLLSAAKENPTVKRKYMNAKATTLRFALGFRDEGASMSLLLQSPDGRRYKRECDSTVILEVPDAAVGEWTYTVTALKLPYPNFPFTVRIGEK